MKKSCFYVLSLGCALAGCRQEIPSGELPDFTPKLVINSELNNEGPVSIQVSSSTFAYSIGSPEILADASISLFENGVQVPLSYDDFFDRYESNVIPKPGSLYTVSAGKPGFPSVTAQARIPELLRNKTSIYIQDGGIDNNGNASDLLGIAFTDDPDKTNFYKVNFFYYSESLDQYLGFDYTADDPSLNAYDAAKTDDGGFVFTDRLFNGQRKEFRAVPPAGLVFNNTDVKYLIEIRHLSEEYYRYYTSLSKFKEYMEEPGALLQSGISVYSNITGGLGIFAGTQLESDTIR